MRRCAPAEILRRGRRFVLPAMILCAACGLQALAGFHPHLTERYYSRGLYPHISRGLAFTNWVGDFSVAEALLITLLAVIAGWLVWRTHQLRRRRIMLGEFAALVTSLTLWLAGGGLLLFLLVWGLNYQRQPLAERLPAANREASLGELEAISRTLVAEINRNYQESGAGGGGGGGDIPPVPVPTGRVEIIRAIEASFRSEPLLRGVETNLFGAPKPIYFSGLMSRLRLTGVYSPFTGEANYNVEQPGFDLPFTIAHEMAHQRGFAREDEASFIAFLACIKSSDPRVRYSGYLNSLGVLGALARRAPERYREVTAGLAPGPRADLRARAAFWKQYGGRFGEMSSQVNNFYLKANRVNSGVKNYNEVTALIVGYYLTQWADGLTAAG